MFATRTKLMMAAAIAGLLAPGFMFRTTVIAGQAAVAPPQTASSAAPAVSPRSPTIVAGEVEARKLLLLMDADKNGKVSRAEFMAFMAAEFDRLDTNKDGELDVKELAQSQLTTAHHGGGHR